ncbi:hypothetical protein WK64_14285 [Burkholderia ubonensis]|nr:hypothetical protein WK64_14285 [Burkholderia ubonensis]
MPTQLIKRWRKSQVIVKRQGSSHSFSNTTKICLRYRKPLPKSLCPNFDEIIKMPVKQIKFTFWKLLFSFDILTQQCKEHWIFEYKTIRCRDVVTNKPPRLPGLDQRSIDQLLLAFSR